MNEYEDFAALDEQARWLEYEKRKAAYIADSPGAYPSELESFCQQLAQELGL